MMKPLRFDFGSQLASVLPALRILKSMLKGPLGKKHFLTEMRGLGFGFGSKAIGSAKDKASSKAKSKAALGSILKPPSFDFGASILQAWRFPKSMLKASSW